MKPLLIAIFLTGLLAGCGNSVPKLLAAEAKVTVVFEELTQTKAQGVPSLANSAIVQVFLDGSSDPIRTLVLTYAARSTVVSLESGKTYRFDTSFRQSEKELAWGSQSKTISEDMTITLSGRSIGDKIQVGKATYQGSSGLITIPVKVLGPTDSPISLADFGDPVFTVKGGTIVGQSKLGLEIKPDKGAKNLSLEAQVSVFDAKHGESTVSLGVTTIDLSPLIVASGMEFSTKLKNWPQELPVTGFTAQAIAVGDKPVVVASSSLGENGEIKLNLPDQKGLEVLGVYKEKDYSGYMCQSNYGGATGTDSRLMTSRVYLQLSGPDGQTYPLVYGEYGGLPNAPLPWDNYSSRMDYIVFSPNQFQFSSSCNTVYRQSTYVNHEFNPGWNYVQESGFSSSQGGSSWSSSSYTPTSSQAWFIYSSDISVSLATNPLKPGFEPFNYVVSLNGGGWFAPGNHPAVVEGAITFSGSDYLYLSAGSVANTSSGSNYYTCEWNPVSNTKKLNFRCMIYTSNTVQFSLPMPAQPTSSNLTATVDIVRSGWLDSNFGNNHDALSFLGGVHGITIGGIDASSPSVYLGKLGSATKVGQQVEIVGSAFDYGQGSKVARVEIYDGTSLVGEATFTEVNVYETGQNVWWKFMWTPTRSGGHTLRAVAYDLVGNSGVGETLIDIQAAQ